MMGHLAKLQEIADAHGGTRAVGTPGYEASVDYVVNALRGKGFRGADPQFQTKGVRVAEGPGPDRGRRRCQGQCAAVQRRDSTGRRERTAGGGTQGRDAGLRARRLSDGPAGEGRGPAGRPRQLSFLREGGNRGETRCGGLIIADNVDEEKMGGTLGQDNDVTIPVVSISKADGRACVARPTRHPQRRRVDQDHRGPEMSSPRPRPDQARTWSWSVATSTVSRKGPVSTTTARGGRRAGDRSPAGQRAGGQQRRPVRLLGPRKSASSGQEVRRVAQRRPAQRHCAVSHFDMLGSPNPGYFTYDGNQSTELPSDTAPPRVPEGSGGSSGPSSTTWKSVGKAAEDTGFDGRSDYDGFTMAGIPRVDCSPAPRREVAAAGGPWGGTPNASFDLNYHQGHRHPRPHRPHRAGYQRRGVAWPSAYAQDLSGRNGIPARETAPGM